MLSGLKERLLAPELIEVLVREFNAELERQRTATRGQSALLERKIADMDRKIGAILKAIEDGMCHPGMKDRMGQLEAERTVLIAERTPNPMADVTLLVHPNVPDLYRRKVAELERLLECGEECDEARELIRSMVDCVVLAPRASGGREAGSGFICLSYLSAFALRTSCARRRWLPDQTTTEVEAGGAYLGGCWEPEEALVCMGFTLERINSPKPRPALGDARTMGRAAPRPAPPRCDPTPASKRAAASAC